MRGFLTFCFISAILVALRPPVVRAQMVTNSGGCVIIHLGNVSQPKPNIDAFCSGLPSSLRNGTPFADVYGGWAPPLLAGAWDNAERSFCGTPGCATANEHVRIILTSNGQANAANASGTGYGDIFITSGMLDFVESSSRGLVADMASFDVNGKPAPDGYVHLLATMRQNGTKTCDAIVPLPAVHLTKDQLKAEIVVAQSVYTFVFGHELAHMQSAGARCDYSGGDPLALEERCDQISMSKVLSHSTAFPPGIFATLAALKDYEVLQAPTLDAALGDPTNPEFLRQTHLVRNWGVRGQKLIDQWEETCRDGLQSQAGCPGQWKANVAASRRWMALPEPESCTVAVN